MPLGPEDSLYQSTCLVRRGSLRLIGMRGVALPRFTFTNYVPCPQATTSRWCNLAPPSALGWTA